MKIFSQRLAGVFFIFAINASATTHYVDLNSANATLPFTNWITAATNIQDAIDVAVAGDSIVVSNGVYRGGIVATNAIRLQSVNGAGVTWIDGSHAKGCANLADGAALTSFTLTNGYAFNGGGVYCASANTFVSSCLIVSNTAWGHYAGGVFGGTVSNCTVNYNLTPSGNGLDGGGAA